MPLTGKRIYARFLRPSSHTKNKSLAYAYPSPPPPAKTKDSLACIYGRVNVVLYYKKVTKSDTLPLLHTTSFLRILATDSQSIDCSAVVIKKTGSVIGVQFELYMEYRSADKSLARPGRKQATATEDFDVHIYYL
jgi:hypothetical protein